MHRSFQFAACLKRCARIAIFCALAYSTIAMAAEDVLFQSTEKQVTLIELFTAEGCSSCPPAEASLSKLKADRALWKNLVPIAFHVDYWDGRGWKDRFASPAFTQRQRAYAAAWKSGSVYTPAFAVNGREWRGSGTPTSSATANAGVLKIARAGGNRLTLTYAHFPGLRFSWDAHVALLGSEIVSKVGGGENSGRELQHDFVVLKYDRLRMAGDAGIARAELDLPESQLEKGSRPALAAWVTIRDQIVPIQATGGWLP